MVVVVAVRLDEYLHRPPLIYQYMIIGYIVVIFFCLIYPPGDDNEDTLPGEIVQQMVAEVRATGRGRKRNVSRAVNMVRPFERDAAIGQHNG